MSRSLFLLLAVMLSAALSTIAQPSTATVGIPDATPVITITYVKTPWYGFQWLLHYGFRKSVPEYQAIAGLQSKYYAHTEGADTFGGIYQWRSAADARRQFAPSWFARVKEKYSVEGRVDYFTLVRVVEPSSTRISAGGQESEAQATIIPVASQALVEAIALPQSGLLRSYVVEQNGQTGLILLFENQKARERFANSNSLGAHSILTTPLLLKN